jgi:hypothetical protein
MSKKDYERAARIVRPWADLNRGHAEELCAAFIALFAGDNPRFDAERFRAACGVAA